LSFLTDKNPFLISQLVSEEWGAIESLFERGKSISGAGLYKNLRSYISLQKRERLLKYIIPKVVGEGRWLYERGIRTRLRELRSYKLGEEWDLEVTVDQMLSTASKKLDYSDIRIRKEKENKRGFVILTDQSNSLTKYIDYIALTTAMLSFVMKMDHLAVVGFQSDTMVLKGMQQAIPLEQLLTRILELDCNGGTDLYKPLAQAQKELDKLPNGIMRQVILISDCTPTTGQNPLHVAKSLSRLHILYIPPVVFADRCMIKPLARLENIRVYEIKRFEDVVDYVQAIVGQDGWD
jgi:ribosomal protein S15P/S13E